MNDGDDVNFAEMEPEYDMEFARYGPNPIELPMSPPQTPPAGPGNPVFERELSPFSEASSMTSVNSTDSVGALRRSFWPIGIPYKHAYRLLSRRRRQNVPQPGERVHLISPPVNGVSTKSHSQTLP